MLPREWCAKPANVKLLQKAVDAFVAAPRSERGIRAQLAAVQRFSIAKHLHAVTCRALVLHGDVDAVVPVENALLLKSLLSNRRGQSKMLLLNSIGHLPHIQEPHELAKLVADFLDDVDAKEPDGP